MKTTFAFVNDFIYYLDCMIETNALDINQNFIIEVETLHNQCRIGIKKNPDYSDTFPKALVQSNKLLAIEYNGKTIALQKSHNEAYYYTATFTLQKHADTIAINVSGNTCQTYTIANNSITSKNPYPASGRDCTENC